MPWRRRGRRLRAQGRGLCVLEFQFLLRLALALHFRQVVFTLDTDAGQDADRVVFDLLQHRAEHIECFPLVFLLRVLLRI